MLKDQILYLDEWRDSKGKLKALPDTTTSNKHFLRLCETLRRMGVKNYTFPLALRDQSLKGVDPHKLTLENDPTGELMTRVTNEAHVNIWYYLRECIRFPGSSGPTHMTFNRANCAMAWCFLQGIDYIAIQPRQTGKTTMALILSCWCIWTSCYKFGMGLYTSNDNLRKKNLEALRSIRDSLPWYFTASNKGGIDNSEMIYYRPLKNNFWSFISQKAEVAANNTGRGYAICSWMWDEPAFCYNLKISAPVMAAATTTASNRALNAGMPYSSLYTTTAGDPSTESGGYMFDRVKKAFKMSEKLYDFKDRKSVRIFLDNNSINGSVNGTYSHLQLGKTNEWLIKEIKKHNYSYDTVLRDFLNRWYVGAGNPILSQEIIKRITGSRASNGPLHTEILDDFCISWYVDENEIYKWENKTFICGLDASEMVGEDFTTAVAIDPKTLRTLFTFRCNSSNITKVSRFIATLMSKYKRMILVPEAKSSGRVIVDEISENLIAKGVSPFTRIFNKVVQEKSTNPSFNRMNFRDPSLYNNGGRKYVGFVTTGASRNTLYKDVLQKAAKISADKILDGTLIDELISLEVRNGRIDHGEGKHDDMVISWLLANWLIFHGKDLQCYGLDTSDIENITSSGNAEKNITEKEIKLRNIYQKTLNRMHEEKDLIVKDALRQRLHVLKSYMSEDVILEPISREVSRKGGYRFSNEENPENSFSSNTSLFDTLNKIKI